LVPPFLSCDNSCAFYRSRAAAPPRNPPPPCMRGFVQLIFSNIGQFFSPLPPLFGKHKTSVFFLAARLPIFFFLYSAGRLSFSLSFFCIKRKRSLEPMRCASRAHEKVGPSSPCRRTLSKKKPKPFFSEVIFFLLLEFPDFPPSKERAVPD